jgi:hypothetical protein
MSYIGATPTDIPLTSSDLADGLVTAAKLATDSVTTVKVVDDNVTTAKVLDNNVTLAKIADGTQGDILYYGASGAPTLLGFGTSGDFLKTQGTGANPAWDTVAAADVVLITTQTLGSDSATWSIDGFYSATYTNYLFHMYDYWCSNAGNQVELQFNASASALTASNYRHVSWRAYMESGSSGSGVQGGFTAAHVTLNTGSGTITQLGSMQVMIWDPLATDTYKALTYMAGNDENTQINVKFGHCMYTTGDTTAHSGITLTQGGSGDIKAGMKIKIYGYK